MRIHSGDQALIHQSLGSPRIWYQQHQTESAKHGEAVGIYKMHYVEGHICSVIQQKEVNTLPEYTFWSNLYNGSVTTSPY